MPGAEVRHARTDHAAGVVELLLYHADPLPTRIRTQLFALQGLNDSPSIAPTVEVAVVEGEHLAYEGEFAVPQLPSGGPWEVEGTAFEEPEPVVPDPVTFGEFAEEGEYEGEVVGNEVEDVNTGRGPRGRLLVASGKGLRGLFEWRARSEQVLEYAAAVIPYRVVFRV